jgi:hypothetical protein
MSALPISGFIAPELVSGVLASSSGWKAEGDHVHDHLHTLAMIV